MFGFYPIRVLCTRCLLINDIMITQANLYASTFKWRSSVHRVGNEKPNPTEGEKNLANDM